MVSALACGNKWIQGGTYKFETTVNSTGIIDYDVLIYEENYAIVKMSWTCKRETMYMLVYKHVENDHTANH